MQLMQIIGDGNVRLIPDILVGGGNGSTNGLVDGLLSMILWNQTGKKGEGLVPISAKPESPQQNSNPPIVVALAKD